MFIYFDLTDCSKCPRIGLIRPTSPPLHRSIRCARRGDGEKLLSQVHRRLHTKVLEAPPHGRGLLWHRISAHAVHGTSRVSPETSRQPVRAAVSRMNCNSPLIQGVQDVPLGSNAVSLDFFFDFSLYGFKIHSLAYQIQLQAAANFKAPMRGVMNGN